MFFYGVFGVYFYDIVLIIWLEVEERRFRFYVVDNIFDKLKDLFIKYKMFSF